MLILNMTQTARVLKDYMKPDRFFERHQGNALMSFGQNLELVFRLLLTEETPNQCMMKSEKQLDPQKS